MRNIIRFYNQNRLAFWIIVAIIAFVIIIIHVLNGLVIEKNKNNQNNQEIVSNNEETIKQEQKKSQPIIDGNTLSDSNKDENAQLIDSFLLYCKTGEINKAYSLLSSNCKEIYFQTVEQFENEYCKNKFSSDKKSDYELWTSSGFVIYRVKFSENILASGNISNTKTIEDYYSIVFEGSQKKLNINGYIGRNNINKEINKNNFVIKVDYVDIYLDNYLYTLTIKNNTNNTVVLDTRTKSGSVYLTNSNNSKYSALLYENSESDLIFNINEQKNLKIKFSINNKGNSDIRKLTFSDVVLYSNNLNEKIQIEIEI